jgi:prephenate dehydrogenase
VLTPVSKEELRTPAALEFTGWVRRIGAETDFTTAAVHDGMVAYISHLPQLTSTALAACVSREFSGHAPPVWGPALVDSTRLALSHFDIWGDILQTNPIAIDAALADYIGHLQQMRELLASTEMKQYFEEAAGLARRLRDSA